MRRLPWLCVALLLGLSAAAGQRPDLASVVSEDVLLYAEVSDPRGMWAEFEKSAAMDVLRAVPGAEVAFRAALGMGQQAARQKLGIEWDQFARKHLGRLALVLVDVPTAQLDGVVLLLDGSEHKADLTRLIVSTIEPTLRKTTPGTTLRRTVYQDVPIRSATVGPMAVAYAFLDDVLALGTPKGIRTLIDSRVQRPLSAGKVFASVREKLAAPKGAVAYLHVARLLEALRPQIDATQEMARALDDSGLSAVKFAAVGVAFEDGLVRERVYLHTGEQRMGLLRLLTALSPGTPGAAAVLPKECPMLLELTFKDGGELWNAMLRFLEGGGDLEGMARLDEGREQIRLQFGIDFDHDFVAALGGSAFVAANPGFIARHAPKGFATEKGDLPVILGVRAADREALASMIHRVVASQPVVGQGVDRAVSKHRGTEISTLTIPGAPIKPSYAFVGDYILLARSKAILQKCLDAKATGQGLASAPQLQALLKKAPAKRNATLYVDAAGLLTAAAGDRAPRATQLLASRLGVLCATLSADKEGVLIESRSRIGLLGILPLLEQFKPGPRPAPRPAPKPATRPAPAF